MILMVERPSYPSFFQIPVVGPETACNAMMTTFGYTILAYVPSLLNWKQLKFNWKNMVDWNQAYEISDSKNPLK